MAPSIPDRRPQIDAAAAEAIRLSDGFEAGAQMMQVINVRKAA